MSRGYDAFDGVSFTIGDEAANVINVSCQLTSGGQAVTEACSFNCYLSDDAAGQTVGTAHSTSPAIGTNGLLSVLVTDLCWLATSEATGIVDIDFTDSGTQTVYLNVVLPSGKLVTSGAITHAA